jgi:UDP-3-O-acyl-N-acetylglucosamine deacetylase
MVPDLNDIEPEALREAEFGTVQAVLDSMVGTRIVSATLDETHIEIRTDDGSAYSFYGFLGSSGPKRSDADGEDRDATR